MRSNAVISPMPLHTEERRGEAALDVALRVSPAGHYSNTHRHYKVHETGVGHYSTNHTFSDTAAYWGHSRSFSKAPHIQDAPYL